MFETSMVLARTRPARGRIGLFTASLLAHSAAIVGAVAVSVASVDFPKTAPNETALFLPAQPPPPLGNPNGGAPPKPAATPPVQKQTTPPPPPNQITAPSTVPDETPVVEGPSNSDATATGPVSGEPGPIGVPWGDPHGVGDPDAPPAVVNVPPVQEKIFSVTDAEVKPPVALYRVQPPYPQSMIRVGMPATVVVRCIIDRNGNVRDPQLLVPAMPPFNNEVVKAVKQWRFTPGSFRGQAVEVYLDLTVHFSVKR